MATVRWTVGGRHVYREHRTLETDRHLRQYCIAPGRPNLPGVACGSEAEGLGREERFQSRSMSAPHGLPLTTGPAADAFKAFNYGRKALSPNPVGL